jgi:F-type H+-transporting ATPase subunit epsilon
VATPFEVYLVTPEREVWSGRATFLVARGTEGEVGILAGHVPMLLELAISPLFITTEDGQRIAVAIDGGFLHVISEGMDTRVDILAEHAELETEIDLDKARHLQAEAERLLQERDNGAALAMLAKAQVRISLRG